jgi:hypothetical protein
MSRLNFIAKIQKEHVFKIFGEIRTNKNDKRAKKCLVNSRKSTLIDVKKSESGN